MICYNFGVSTIKEPFISKKHLDLILSSESFCVFPFIHMNVKPHKNKMVAPCWRSLENMGSIEDLSFQEIWSGQQANDLREKMLTSQRPEGCKRCWSIEDNPQSKSISLRNRYNERYRDRIPEIAEKLDSNQELTLISAEIRFSSLCNFRCLHCHPANSTKWQALWKDNPDVQKLVPANPKGLPNKITTKERIDEFIANYSASLEEFWVCGGEPLIEPLHYYFLEQYPAEKAKNVDLVVCTNFSKLELGKHSVKDLWGKFKFVDVRIGIDGDEDSFAYFREGGNFEILKRNIEIAQSWKLPNLKIGATCTVNILNISRLKRIYQMSRNLGIEFVYTFLNSHPDYLDIRNLPQEHKVQYSKMINEIISEPDITKSEAGYLERVITFMNSREANENEIENLKQYCKVMDRASGKSHLEVFPELNDLLA